MLAITKTGLAKWPEPVSRIAVHLWKLPSIRQKLSNAFSAYTSLRKLFKAGATVLVSQMHFQMKTQNIATFSPPVYMETMETMNTIMKTHIFEYATKVDQSENVTVWKLIRVTLAHVNINNFW